MTETEFDEAFSDLISRPWPRPQNSWDRDLQPAAMTRVFPDFGARPIGGTHGTRLGTHPRGGSRGGDPRISRIGPGTHPRERSLGVSFLGTEPQPNDNEVRNLGTCATVAREGSLVPWCVDINTPDEPAALGFSCVDINTTAAPTRHDIMTRPDPVAHGFSRMDLQTTAASNRHDIVTVA